MRTLWLIFVSITAVASWFAFWYQVGWGDSWRFAMTFFAVNMICLSIISEERKRIRI